MRCTVFRNHANGPHVFTSIKLRVLWKKNEMSTIRGIQNDFCKNVHRTPHHFCLINYDCPINYMYHGLRAIVKIHFYMNLNRGDSESTKKNKFTGFSFLECLNSLMISLMLIILILISTSPLWNTCEEGVKLSGVSHKNKCT